MADSKIVVFQDKQIRRVWVDDDWYFSIVDIVGVLTGSPEPRKYWNKVKTREFTDLQLSPIWRQLKLPAADGKQYRTDCASYVSYHPVDPLSKGRAIQTMAGTGRI